MKKPVAQGHETTQDADYGDRHIANSHTDNPLLRGIILQTGKSEQTANVTLIEIEGAYDVHSLNDALKYILDYLGRYWTEPQYSQIIANALTLLEQQLRQLQSRQPEKEYAWRAWGKLFSLVCAAYNLGRESARIGRTSEEYRSSLQVDEGMIEAIKTVNDTTSAQDTLWRLVNMLRGSIKTYQMTDYLDQSAKLYMQRMNQLLKERGADGYGVLTLPDFRPFFTLAARSFAKGELAFLSEKSHR